MTARALINRAAPVRSRYRVSSRLVCLLLWHGPSYCSCRGDLHTAVCCAAFRLVCPRPYPMLRRRWSLCPWPRAPSASSLTSRGRRRLAPLAAVIAQGRELVIIRLWRSAEAAGLGP